MRRAAGRSRTARLASRRCRAARRAAAAGTWCWRRRRASSTGSVTNAAAISRPAASSVVFSHPGIPAAARGREPGGLHRHRMLRRARPHRRMPRPPRRRPVPRPGPPRRDGHRRPRDGQHQPSADHAGISADAVPVGRIQRPPATRHTQPGRDTSQRITSRHHIPGRHDRTGHHQHQPGTDHIRIARRRPAVGRIQHRPATPHTNSGGDARQRVARAARHTGPDATPRPPGLRRHSARWPEQPDHYCYADTCALPADTWACRQIPAHCWQIPAYCCGGCECPPEPQAGRPKATTAATRRTETMLQANTTHADFVHARIVHSLSFQGDQRQTRRPSRQRLEPVGRKGLTPAGPPAAAHATPA